MDRTTTIRASVRNVETTLIGSIILVVLVVFVFLRSPRATLIPSVAVPVSLIGTFAVMYMAGYTLDNLSLMALTVATGFVVDDAIVVMENITRHLEAGMEPFAASLQGAREIGFTVFSISMSLIAVFIPILMMGGIVGRLFREFAVVLSTAILVSMVVSLTTTPTMCAHLLKAHRPGERHNVFYRAMERFFTGMLSMYKNSLTWVLDNPALTIIVLALTIALNVVVIVRIPKGFFPQQDTGSIQGGLQGPQDASFPFMKFSIQQVVGIIKADPAVEHVNGYIGGRGPGGGIYIALKPLGKGRKVSATEVINRLRPKLNRLPIASAFLQAAQDLRIGGRGGNAQYQYTIQTENIPDLARWGPILMQNMRRLPGLQDVNSDQQNGGLEQMLTFDRASAARLGQTAQSLDRALYSAFGQSQVSVIYKQLNQYYVVLEVAPKYWQDPSGLNNIYLAPSASANKAGINGDYAADQRDEAKDRHHAPAGEPHWPVPVGHGFVQPGPRLFIERRDARNHGDGAKPGHAGYRAWVLFRDRAGLSAIAGHREISGHHRAAGGLYRARHSVRKPDAPIDDHFHAAIGQRRRDDGADALQHRSECHFHHRHHPADRDREEERHHDDRLCPDGGAAGRQEHARRHLRGVPVALPAHHDDHDGRDLRRAAAGFRHRHRFGASPPAGHHDRRRAGHEPIADAFTTPVVYLMMDRLRLSRAGPFA